MQKRHGLLLIAGLLLLIAIITPGCKSCNKDKTEAPKVDTTAASTLRPSNTLNLPHADTSLIPIFSKLLDDAFAASDKKDYAKLGSLIIYRGPEEKRYGQDVFNVKNGYEKAVIRITADVFNKWNKGLDTHDYTRVFDLDQPNGQKLQVMEVIFVSKKNIDRKFFGFLQINGEYKIADVTSSL